MAFKYYKESVMFYAHACEWNFRDAILHRVVGLLLDPVFHFIMQGRGGVWDISG